MPNDYDATVTVTHNTTYWSWKVEYPGLSIASGHAVSLERALQDAQMYGSENGYAKPVLRNSTIENYVYARNRLRKHYPEIEALTLDALTPLDFQRMLNALASICSKSSLSHIKVVYCEAYQEAVRNNLCTRNPIRETQIPKQASRKKVTGMSVSEQKAFESTLLQLAFMDNLSPNRHAQR